MRYKSNIFTHSLVRSCKLCYLLSLIRRLMYMGVSLFFRSCFLILDVLVGLMALTINWLRTAWTIHSINGWLCSSKWFSRMSKSSSIWKGMHSNALQWSSETSSTIHESASIWYYSRHGNFWINTSLFSRKFKDMARIYRNLRFWPKRKQFKLKKTQRAICAAMNLKRMTKLMSPME